MSRRAKRLHLIAHWKCVSKRTGSLVVCGLTLSSAPAKIRSHCAVRLCVLQLAFSLWTFDCTSVTECMSFSCTSHFWRAAWWLFCWANWLLTRKFSFLSCHIKQDSWKKLCFFALSVISPRSCKVTKDTWVFFCGRWVFWDLQGMLFKMCKYFGDLQSQFLGHLNLLLHTMQVPVLFLSWLGHFEWL